MPTESTTLSAPHQSKTLDAESRTAQQRVEGATLSASEAHRLIGICIELIDLCAKVTGKIDPATGTILGYARDEVLSGALEIGS